MIAIPIDSESIEAKSSKLFGNVSSFAIYDPKSDKFKFVTNTESGNGINTVKLLTNLDVKSVVYSYMGDGPFNSLSEDHIDVYYIGKEPMKLSEITQGLGKEEFVKVTKENAKTYLDPGTGTGDCSCGCSHE